MGLTIAGVFAMCAVVHAQDNSSFSTSFSHGNATSEFKSPFSLPLSGNQSMYSQDSLKMAGQSVKIFKVQGLSPSFNLGTQNGTAGYSNSGGFGENNNSSTTGKVILPGMTRNPLHNNGTSQASEDINTLLFPMSVPHSTGTNSLLTGTPFLTNNKAAPPITDLYSDSTYDSPDNDHQSVDSSWNSW
ncbi:MAG TPA: hypothetical protein VNE41_10630 [Chitinophagaceae bacterium]|nr:hypothetical protein [Chitinophagaceae bacterium]